MGRDGHTILLFLVPAILGRTSLGGVSRGGVVIGGEGHKKGIVPGDQNRSPPDTIPLNG